MIHLRTLLALFIVAAATCLAACQRAPEPVATLAPTKGMVPINDIQIYYEIHGDGTPLILLT